MKAVRALAALVSLVHRPIDFHASPMEEHNQIGGVGPLELLLTRLNIHTACCAGMGLEALTNEHSTWHDGWKYTAINKAE